jgi:glutamyl/glutaminyl-tRNA synthetase
MLQESRFKKTRLAPTPSGFLHLGNVFSFALTAALAKKTGAKILLRIDDLDRKRVNELYVQDLFETLRFMQIPFDEGPADVDAFETTYSQLHRLAHYNDALQKLKRYELVYACACSRTQIMRDETAEIYRCACRHKNISLDAEQVSWRLKTLEDKTLAVKTLAGTYTYATLPKEMQDFVVRKKDGQAAYQLTSVIDDLHFGIDLVVRGADLWPSTLAQLYLATVLEQAGFLETTFYHHPLLLDPGNRKLSKSKGDTSVRYLRNQGLKPADIYSLISQQLNAKSLLQRWQDLADYL